MKIETKYNVGDEVILSGVVCVKIERIIACERQVKEGGIGLEYLRGTGEIIVVYCGSSAFQPFTDEDIICLKSDFLAHFSKTPEGGDHGGDAAN